MSGIRSKPDPLAFTVTMDHVRRLHCSSGARRWFEAHGLDFRDFLKNGIDAVTFVARGDGLSFRVAQLAMADELRKIGARFEQAKTQS